MQSTRSVDQIYLGHLNLPKIISWYIYELKNMGVEITHLSCLLIEESDEKRKEIDWEKC